MQTWAASWRMTLAWFGLAVLVSLGSCKVCRFHNPVQIYQDMACPDNDDEKLLKQIPHRECMSQCVQDVCHLVSYNQQNANCVLTQRPCVVLEPRPGFMTQTLRTSADSDCLQWQTYVSGSADPPRIVEISSTRVTIAIVRFPHEEDLLPGKITDTASREVYSVYNSQSVHKPADNTVEFLVVHPTCNLIWLPYNATNLGPLPRGALVAGRKDNGIPLYVAGSFFSIPEAHEYTTGYYDPQIREAYFELFGVPILKAIDILCVA